MTRPNQYDSAYCDIQGYDHENDRDAAAMEKRERTLLARFGYPDPYKSPETSASRGE